VLQVLLYKAKNDIEEMENSVKMNRDFDLTIFGIKSASYLRIQREGLEFKPDNMMTPAELRNK